MQLKGFFNNHLASLLVSSAPLAHAVMPPGGAVLGARSLMDVLAAAPRGLMSLLSLSTHVRMRARPEMHYYYYYYYKMMTMMTMVLSALLR